MGNQNEGSRDFERETLIADDYAYIYQQCLEENGVKENKTDLEIRKNILLSMKTAFD